MSEHAGHIDVRVTGEVREAWCATLPYQYIAQSPLCWRQAQQRVAEDVFTSLVQRQLHAERQMFWELFAHDLHVDP